MLTKRIAVALIGIPLVFLVLYGGERSFLALIAGAAFLTLLEAGRLTERIQASAVIRAMATVLAVAYVVASFGCLYLIYDLKSGPVLVVFTLIAVWTADTSAYLIGNWIGKRPLAPKISPNKTIEGAVGSLIVTAGFFAALTVIPGLSGAERLIFGGLLAVAALVGDLLESRLKRLAKVKDSGSMLPGHGGILDRVDSLLAAVPVSYIFLRFFA